jgi:hypothetical protein
MFHGPMNLIACFEIVDADRISIAHVFSKSKAEAAKQAASHHQESCIHLSSSCGERNNVDLTSNGSLSGMSEYLINQSRDFRIIIALAAGLAMAHRQIFDDDSILALAEEFVLIDSFHTWRATEGAKVRIQIVFYFFSHNL